MIWTRQESYQCSGDPILAQRLNDEGLLYAVNRLVLGQVGFALGVTGVPVPNSVIVGGLLLAGSDESITYGALSTHTMNMIRLRKAGHGALAMRIEEL